MTTSTVVRFVPATPASHPSSLSYSDQPEYPPLRSPSQTNSATMDGSFRRMLRGPQFANPWLLQQNLSDSFLGKYDIPPSLKTSATDAMRRVPAITTQVVYEDVEPLLLCGHWMFDPPISQMLEDCYPLFLLPPEAATPASRRFKAWLLTGRKLHAVDVGSLSDAEKLAYGYALRVLEQYWEHLVVSLRFDVLAAIDANVSALTTQCSGFPDDDKSVAARKRTEAFQRRQELCELIKEEKDVPPMPTDIPQPLLARGVVMV